MAAPLRLDDYLEFSGFVDVYADAALDVLGEIDVALEYLSTDTLSDIVARVQWINSAIVRLMKACA